MKQNDNPIYEGGPLYENVEEQLYNSQHTTSTQPMRVAFSRSIDNIYHSEPISIPGSSQGVELYAEIKSCDIQTVGEGDGEKEGDEREEVEEEGERGREGEGVKEEEGEEEAYTVMRSPVASAGVSYTSYREDRAAWLGNRLVQ